MHAPKGKYPHHSSPVQKHPRRLPAAQATKWQRALLLVGFQLKAPRLESQACPRECTPQRQVGLQKVGLVGLASG